MTCTKHLQCECSGTLSALKLIQENYSFKPVCPSSSHAHRPSNCVWQMACLLPHIVLTPQIRSTPNPSCRVRAPSSGFRQAYLFNTSRKCAHAPLSGLFDLTSAYTWSDGTRVGPQRTPGALQYSTVEYNVCDATAPAAATHAYYTVFPLKYARKLLMNDR